MSTTVLCVLIGLPGSGKTNFAKLLKSESQKLPSLQVIHICFDKIFDEEKQKVVVSNIIKTPECKLFKDLRNSYYNLVKQVLMLKIDSSFQCPKFSFLQGIDLFKESKKHVIVLDDNFYYKSMRYKYYQLACQFSTGFCQIYFDCEKLIAEQNNKSRSVQVPLGVIETMNDKMEAPADCFWEKQSVALRCSNMSNFLLDIPTIFQLLDYNFDNYLSPPKNMSEEIEQSKQQCLRSISHQTDLMLRSFITEEISYLKEINSNKSHLKMLSSNLNKVRQNILEKIRNRSIDFSSFICNETVNREKLKSMFKSEYNLMIVNT